KPPRNAERALPSSIVGLPLQNTKAPETAHSPGSAGLSKINLSEASSWMVRSNFIGAVLASPDQARRAQRGTAAVSSVQARLCQSGAAEDRRCGRSRNVD